MMTHSLKTWPEFFEALRTGEKTFEVRKDDRGFAVGDFLRLINWNPNTDHAEGQELTRRVTYVLRGPAFGIEAGYVVLGLTQQLNP